MSCLIRSKLNNYIGYDFGTNHKIFGVSCSGFAPKIYESHILSDIFFCESCENDMIIYFYFIYDDKPKVSRKNSGIITNYLRSNCSKKLQTGVNEI